MTAFSSTYGVLMAGMPIDLATITPLTAIFYVVLLALLGLPLAMMYAIQAQADAKYVSVEDLQKIKLPRECLFRILQPHLIPMKEICARGYSSVLVLVQAMIGVQPTCDCALEIWKPAFQCYNLIVPNFLNFPQLLLPGYEIRDLVALTNYVSSRANECTYCSSHCCSFAMRRGVDPAVLRNALPALLNEGGGETMLTSRERAVVRVSYGLGTVPSCLHKEDCEALQKELSPDRVEWIVAAAAMFGAFNKYMDGLGIPLEPDTYAETMDHMDNKFVPSKPASAAFSSGGAKQSLPTPPVDDWKLKLSCLYQGLRPGGALALDAKLLEGIPTKAEDCIAFLQDLTGAIFPVLSKLKHDRFRRALTAILSKNMVSDTIQLRTKVLAGINFCDVLQNKQLQLELQEILAQLDGGHKSKDDNEQLLLKAAKALSYNPSRMTAELVDEIEASALSAENMVELVSFLAAIQALHRVEAYFQVAQ